MVVLLVAGIVVILAGVLAVGFGIPVKEFSFGNTLILTGTIGTCTGLIMLSLVAVVRELKTLARGLAAAEPAPAARPARDLPALDLQKQPVAIEEAEDGEHAGPEPVRDGPLFSRDQPALARSLATDPAPPPWQDDALGDRERARHAAAPSSPKPADRPTTEAKPRRSLLFASSARKERERAAAQAMEQDAGEAAGPPDVAAASTSFEDAWPQTERPRTATTQRQGPRPPSTFSDAPPEPPPVTVLKAGVVDGMAYSLYSDGSIEAQMPEGLMRFESIDELRDHLDHRV